MNTFTGANGTNVASAFPNRGIHYFCSEVMSFRMQLTVRQDFKSQSGWNDALNNFMVGTLERLADTVARITYNTEDKTQAEIGEQAANVEDTLAKEFNVKALTIDNVVMPSSVPLMLPFVLDGTNLDIPQLTPVTCPNNDGRAFVQALDELYVMATRLDSRWQPNTVTRDEAAMLVAQLNVLYTITQDKGGYANRRLTPTGTLPSQEASSFLGNAVVATK